LTRRVNEAWPVCAIPSFDTGTTVTTFASWKDLAFRDTSAKDRGLAGIETGLHGYPPLAVLCWTIALLVRITWHTSAVCVDARFHAVAPLTASRKITDRAVARLACTVLDAVILGFTRKVCLAVVAPNVFSPPAALRRGPAALCAGLCAARLARRTILTIVDLAVRCVHRNTFGRACRSITEAEVFADMNAPLDETAPNARRRHGGACIISECSAVV